MKAFILLSMLLSSAAYAYDDNAFYDGMEQQKQNDWIDQQYQEQMADERRQVDSWNHSTYVPLPSNGQTPQYQPQQRGQ